MQGLIHRHKHKRKSEAEIQEIYEFWKKFLDRVTLVAGILGPLMVIPQIYKIFSEHNAAGVSVLSWGAFAILDVPFILYGIFHKDRPIVTTYALFCIANLIVTIGAIIYR
jgi:uncharacterized protein with PQ loop repeat